MCKTVKKDVGLHFTFFEKVQNNIWGASRKSAEKLNLDSKMRIRLWVSPRSVMFLLFRKQYVLAQSKPLHSFASQSLCTTLPSPSHDCIDFVCQPFYRGYLTVIA